ncbi:MAG: hypothetical protein ACRDQ4_27960 [Pseudonocardiaceae bacterium]
MSDYHETEAYLAAELDTLRHALTTGDHAAVARCLEHVRAEAGPETAAVLERALTEHEALIRHWSPEPAARQGDQGLRPPPAQPILTPTIPADTLPEFLVVFLAVAVVVLLLVVAVLVTVIIPR